jgi:hypothetical protein
MTKNPLLRLGHHFLSLAVPLSCIEGFTRAPDLTSFSNHTIPADIEEYYIWDLSQCDVTVDGLEVDERGVHKPHDADQAFPVLNDLAGGNQAAVTTTAALAADVADNPVNSAASCVLTVQSGTLLPFSPLGPRLVKFQSLATGDTQNVEVARIPDGAELTLQGTGASVMLKVRRRRDGVVWTVTLGKDVVVSGKNPIVTLSNTCGCQVNSSFDERDGEFAAYYELLAAPPPPGARLIPVLTGALVGAGCDSPSVIMR